MYTLVYTTNKLIMEMYGTHTAYSIEKGLISIIHPLFCIRKETGKIEFYDEYGKGFSLVSIMERYEKDQLVIITSQSTYIFKEIH